MSPDERMYWRLATDRRNPFAGEYLAEALRRYGGPANPLQATSNAKWHPPRPRA